MKETLEQFVNRAKVEIDAFADTWRDNAKEYPSDFPMEKEYGDWDQEFRFSDYL